MSKLVRLLIRTDGTTQELPGPVAIAEVARLIGADFIDCINLRHMGEPPHVMCVDDLGYDTEEVTDGNVTMLVPMRARKPVNVEATRLYHLNCRPGTTHAIVGDVLIVPDEDFA